MISIAILALCALSQPAPPAAEPDWRQREGAFLANTRQLTFRKNFLKAGESYFSPDGGRIIFQAIPAPKDGQEPEAFYSMYVARLTDTGLEDVRRISTPGSANTCGWFSPIQPDRVIFAGTSGPPTATDVPGYQRGTGRYVWQFYKETEVYAASLAGSPLAGPLRSREATRWDLPESGLVFENPEYTAECSLSSDGRFLLYANFDRARSEKLGRNHLDIRVYDLSTKKHHTLVSADGYNGGPFFSPDGKSICYRSDRKGDSKLQLFVADLKFDPKDQAVPVGIDREFQITDNEHVQWAPYWHPSGKFLVYAGSEAGHSNYEVFSIEIDRTRLASAAQAAPPNETVVVPDLARARVTFAPGADVLPAFDAAGTKLMWTAQRGDEPGRPSSQLWIADWKAR